jgi:hypothetical protein
MEHTPCRTLSLKEHKSESVHALGPPSVDESSHMVLPDGLYPFIDERLPLVELTMVEAPADLEALFKSQAAANGKKIIRDEPIELHASPNNFLTQHS